MDPGHPHLRHRTHLAAMDRAVGGLVQSYEREVAYGGCPGKSRVLDKKPEVPKQNIEAIRRKLRKESSSRTRIKEASAKQFHAAFGAED